MVSRSLISIAAGLALWASAPMAHETIPGDWCPTGTSVHIVSTFSFRASDLHAWRQQESAGMVCDGMNTRTCGIVDDWFWAQQLVTAHCGGVGLRGSTPEDAIAFVQTPAVFNSEDHHEQYQFSSGKLTGQCVVCRPKVKPPVAAQPLPASR